MQLFRTIIAVETAGGAMSAARCKREGRTLRLSGQVIDAVCPEQLHIEGDELPEVEIRYENPTGNLAENKWKDTGGIDPSLTIDYRNGVNWGKYEPAIKRWEGVSRHVAPHPTRPDGRGGRHRLSPLFTEWMQGWAPGHVTDDSLGLTRNQQIKAAGNGVCTLQAVHAGRQLRQRLKGTNASTTAI